MNSELYFNDKKYISAKRGATITGYTADYIGQLCRSGKIECKQVGRVWFVNEESIIEHKKNASEKTRGNIIFPPVPVVAPKHTQQVQASSVTTATTPSDYVELAHLTGNVIKQVAFMTSLVTAVALIVFFGYGVSRPDFKMQVATVSEKAVSVSKEIVASTQSYVLNIDTVFSRIQISQTATISNAPHAVKIFWDKAMSTMRRYALGVYRTISGVFDYNTHRTVAVREQEYVDTVSPTTGGRAGLIVVPSTGTQSGDEKIKQNIKNSFSDETEVVPDNTGTSGVIKPVFKESSDQEYLYVMVPIDE